MTVESIAEPESEQINFQSPLTDPHCRTHAAAAIRLTPREQEILTLVAKGYTSKGMGELLSLSIRTIERHRANLRKKFSRKNSASLIQAAIRHGLL